MKISDVRLFREMNDDDISDLAMLGIIRERKFEHGEAVLHAGSTVSALGIVLSGAVMIESCDAFGNRSILSRIGEGEIFAESYAICGETLMVDVICAERAHVAFLELAPLVSDVCIGELDAERRRHLLVSLLSLSSQKNLALSRRIFCTSSHSLRSRVITYLSGEATRSGSREFEVPFNRQQLADYLSVDRSALSKELGRMRDEGMIRFRGRKFILNL